MENTPAAQSASATALPSGGILEVMIDRAMRYPRDPQAALENALAELESVPKLAQKSYYSIPYRDNSGDEAKTTKVEGLSIRAAMAIARFWGNAVTGGRIVSESDSKVHVEGLFYDVETNVLVGRPLEIPKFYKPKGSNQVVRLNADMMKNAIQSGVSKAIRNAALNAIPEWVKEAYFARAKFLVLNPPKVHGAVQKSVAERIAEAKAAFAKNFKVTDAEMAEYIASLGEDVDNQDALLLHLQGLYTAVNEGAQKADDIFRPKADTTKKPTMPQPATPPAGAEKK